MKGGAMKKGEGFLDRNVIRIKRQKLLLIFKRRKK
jgi:hypothetical protein